MAEKSPEINQQKGDLKPLVPQSQITVMPPANSLDLLLKILEIKISKETLMLCASIYGQDL
jgi:hypothetical protein